MTGWTEEGILSAWRALARQAAGEDWRFVHIAEIDGASIEAGCHFPGGREALVVTFMGEKAFDRSRLPEGKGFDVMVVEGQGTLDDRSAIALTRRPEGSNDIFLLIVIDLIRSLERSANLSRTDLLGDFLQRVREWQDFMSRKHRPLSVDAQIGLFGELQMLEMLLDSPLGAAALECWQGPLNAAQDFHIYSGTLEVKSTSSTDGFVARINSIEQLDSDRSPGYLCAFRFEVATAGSSLSDLVSRLRKRLADSGKNRRFDALLLVLGYMDEHADHYQRGFILKEMKGYLLNDELPRLRRASLPAALRSASYTLDLNAINAPILTRDEIFKSFGLKQHELK